MHVFLQPAEENGKVTAGGVSSSAEVSGLNRGRQQTAHGGVVAGLQLGVQLELFNCDHPMYVIKFRGIVELARLYTEMQNFSVLLGRESQSPGPCTVL